MAGTLSDMKSRIAAEILRSDLTTQIANAINDAIVIYQKERFRFSDSDPANPATFNTVVDREVYDSTDNPYIGSLYKIDRLYILIGNTQQAILPEQPRVVRLYNQNTMKGQVSWYAYEGDKLILSPIPSDVWTITIEAFRNVAAPADDTEANNPWMVQAEQLIRARAKYEIALHVTRNPMMAAAMSPDPPGPGQPMGAAYRAWRMLKAETARVTSVGRIRPMAF